MINRKIALALFLILVFCACDNRETDYKVALLYHGRMEGCNLFEEGDANIIVDEHSNLYNTGGDQVEFAFVKDLVYRLQMISKIPKDGWTDTVANINLQDGYVGRLLKDNGSYKYCRFFVYTVDYDANANKYLLLKYQSNFKKD